MYKRQFYDFDAKYLPEEQVSLEVPAEVDEDLRAAVQELACLLYTSPSPRDS